MIKVSVIIPTYNREKTIIRTIRNVMNQTYSNIELIIVDDGSNDNTKNLIEKYILENRDANIKYYYKENGGVSSARNLGIKKSSGKYIAFQDSDDLWENSKLSKQIDELVKSNSDICYCGTILKSCKKEKKIRNKFAIGQNVLKEILKAKADAQTITWVIKKDLISNYNIYFNEKFSYSEDLEFFLKCIYWGKVCCVKEYLAYYVSMEGSLSNNIENQFQEVLMLNEYKKWIDEQNSSFRDNSSIKKIIDNYRMPSRVILALIKIKSIDNYKYKIYYKKYYNIIKKFNPFIGNYKRVLIMNWILILKDKNLK
ncbi:glycosyltransferase family 2 protein [Clostridium perfringens]